MGSHRALLASTEEVLPRVTGFKREQEMMCLRCDNDNEDFIRKDVRFEQEFKGETLFVIAPGVVCSKCGWFTVALDQLDELRRRTDEAYRTLKPPLISAASP